MMKFTHLGPYVIDRQIGKGGMGSVYRATDPASGQVVAIKALSMHLAEAEGFRERFEAEIESLKTLRHEGIVRLYGFGEQDGVLFYSMELIEGDSLEDELKAGRRFDWREVTEIAIQLCSALKHAHDHGIIHRDIKPANILFADERRVKLADFGIARLFGSASSLTTAGGVLGTADYMSPEQADGRPVTARCDQYSLGGVMYALLAGRPPFRAKTLPEMLQLQRFAQPEPVSRYAPDTPKQLEGVIAQLLSKEPADRFPNTAVLARHLQAMVMALTRPSHDSFSLAEELGKSPLSGPDLHNTLAMAVTQAEPGMTPPPKLLVEPQEGAVAGKGHETLLTQDSDGAKSKPQTVRAAAGTNGVTSATANAARPSVFTTVEEDSARRQLEHVRPWLHVAGPLIGLALMVAGLAAAGFYLSKPPTADQLYASISPQIKSGEVDRIRGVEREIGEFVSRFPQDTRTANLEEIQQRLDLDKMHRQLQRRRGGATDPDLLPVEVLYLEAMKTAESSPQRAIEMLEGLILLYGSEPPVEDANDRVATGVQLAQRQLNQWREDFAALNERRLADLQERLATATRLAPTDPQAAKAIRQAIVNLYLDQEWASEIVAEAQRAISTKEGSHD